ncbi:MAG TPA: hypothetical protein PLU17_06910 [Chitinophagaceae bacterium]|nr:hypothetical protein [Chitinophagaceae bacterium]
MEKKVIFLGLNEINFEYLESYINKGYLPNFKKVFSQYGYMQTKSEAKYELLEPWIQWVTVHTGKTYDEHKIFRLGDIVDHPELKQLWNVAEEKGLTVAAISPFNARNDLKNPLFFVPDPWTKTKLSGPTLIQDLGKAVAQAVNDNAQEKVSKSSIVALMKGAIKYISISKIPHYLSIISKIKKPGAKAIFLDSFLADIFIKEWKNLKPDFSSLFLNTGAHVQHHYMFNSLAYQGKFKNPDWYCPAGYDPLLDVLTNYDNVLGEILKLDVRLFILTGLHQKPHEHLTFYWRLKDHQQSLKVMGIEKFEEVLPRMSRDFLINCSSDQEAKNVQMVLESYKSKNENLPIFTIDNRGKSLFVELTYSNDVNDDFEMVSDLNQKVIKLKPLIAFVAIKNGEHDGIGYFIDTNKKYNKEMIPLTQTFSEICSSFN